MSRLGLSSKALVCSIIDSDLKCVSRIRLYWMNICYNMFTLVVDEGGTPHSLVNTNYLVRIYHVLLSMDHCACTLVNRV